MAMLPMSAVRPAGQGSPWHPLTPRITPFLDSANANIYRVIGMDRLTCCRGVCPSGRRACTQTRRTSRVGGDIDSPDTPADQAEHRM